MIEDLLNSIHKPAQYLGNEWNVSRKDINSCAVSFALGFPDLYEVGMSNLGLRLIYGVLNRQPEIACERFFAPERDMEEALKNSGQKLFSLESKKPLKDFDFMGFSLGSELNYTNVLGILELSGLSILSASRDKDLPLVIGGGPCSLNPEPLADFFDLFIIGEAEEAVVELLDIYKKHKEDYKSGRLGKEALLLKLMHVNGVYVPSLYEAKYDPEGRLVDFIPRFAQLPKKIKKRIVENFEAAYFPCDWLVPYVQTVHDRVTLELMRGCPNRCRFCQARTQYYPLRVRKKETVLTQAKAAYEASGYEELALTGLSVGDYPQAQPLIQELSDYFGSLGVNVALPSLKAKALLGEILSIIAKTKKTGLTFAPEAGTARLRQALAKDFSEEEFFQALDAVYQAGYQHLKLYFMTGLPGETDADLQGIIDFAASVSEKKRKLTGSPAQVNISVNPLIPKPHTPLQWQGMDPVQECRRKQDYLRSRCKNRRLKFSFHNFEMASLEGVLSRGDRRLGAVVACAYKKGARFDAWSDSFSFAKWQEAFAETRIDPQDYLQERPLDSLLPWDFIDTGISKENLVKEFHSCKPDPE